MNVIGKYTVKNHDNWGNAFEATIDIVEIGEPRNIRGRTSEGNWAVDYTVPSTLGNTGFRVNTQYFWRKKEALEWIEQRKTQAELAWLEGDHEIKNNCQNKLQQS